MRVHPFHSLRILILVGCLVGVSLIACGTNQTIIVTTPTSTRAAASLSPTSIPTISPGHQISLDDSFCITILTFSEATQIAGMSISYETTVAPTPNGSFLGACTYSVSPHGVDISIAFSPGSDIASLNAAKDAVASQPITPGTVTPVSGLGGGAYAIVTLQQGRGNVYHLLILDGPFIVHIAAVTPVSDNATGIAHLKQIALIVMSRF
jgi:hypothetical protein